jgi:lysine-ketoglutarate reductase/saccharopine dehydrogenase-like protein (TIGR00300 family)
MERPIRVALPPNRHTTGAITMASGKPQHRFLMCPPEFFGVEYEINPWMEGNRERTVPDIARAQWTDLHRIMRDRAAVDLVAPQKGVPDLVFTANAGLVLHQTAILSHFRHPERQREEPYFAEWFAANGFKVIKMPSEIFFEGAGDALLDRGVDRLWVGYGWRTMLEACDVVRQHLDVEVVPLRLVDERFYHLDTCFCPLTGGYLIYYPNAFDLRAQRLIEELVPEDRRFAVSDRDAMHFACNAIDTGDAIVLNNCGTELEQRLRTWGFDVVRTPMTQFILAGGACKCLSLRLDEQSLHRRPQPQRAELPRRFVTMQGHLLDNGLLARIMDLIIHLGGSFEIAEFRAGLRRDDPSTVRLSITAPTLQQLEGILGQLVGIGMQVENSTTPDARLETCDKDGVAPDDFYGTTIFPTDVQVAGKQVRASGQRMDGVLVVDEQRLTAVVKLIRDLCRGDKVVVGHDGIRIHPKKERQADAEEFAFMSSTVSSERRVELAVEQIAWEMMQIRKRNGRIVLVTGPVAVHTGGIEYLIRLVKMGYIGAVLSGNALAVHDIERALYGTSLGVDLKRGNVVHGGHRHHLSAINTMRRHDGIRGAVKAGVLTSGLMFELVKQDVPYVLAGSIRDDGPLPDTQMDLLKAQQAYSEAVKGAEMILMLSTMLHSIGVGNMTPSGVKMVCVDINTAVATKLADRGSVECIPVVTDVGLFLNLLTRKLEELQ